jgi:hypothetical protein
MLLPAISTAEKISNIHNENISKNVSFASDTPNWLNGDKWVYDISINGEMGDAFEYDWEFENLAYQVTDITGSEYILDLSGTIKGDITIFGLDIISGNLKDTTISGELIADKSNLGIKHADIFIDGKIQVVLITKEFTIDLDVSFSPSYYAVNFPIEVGNAWTTTLSNVDGTMDFSLFEDPFIISDIVGGDNAECTEMTTKSVAAGTYNSYKIITDGDIQEQYYAEDAGNIIFAFGSISQDIEVELKSTTYSGGAEPGAPNKPSTPTGSGRGSPGKSYTYSSSTTDNEGDQIFYWFDWGDGTNSDWLGPYDSGDSCSASKVWSSKGTYSIKVKAKDTEDHVSLWSEPLSVTMPRNRAINFNYLLEKLINFFPNLKFFI